MRRLIPFDKRIRMPRHTLSSSTHSIQRLQRIYSLGIKELKLGISNDYALHFSRSNKQDPGVEDSRHTPEI